MSKIMKARCVFEIQLDAEYDVDTVTKTTRTTAAQVERDARKLFVNGEMIETAEKLYAKGCGKGIKTSAKINQTYGDVWYVPENHSEGDDHSGE